MSDSAFMVIKNEELVVKIIDALFNFGISVAFRRGKYGGSSYEPYSGKIKEIHYKPNGIRSFVVQAVTGERITITPDQINYIDVKISVAPQTMIPTACFAVIYFNEKEGDQ